MQNSRCRIASREKDGNFSCDITHFAQDPSLLGTVCKLTQVAGRLNRRDERIDQEMHGLSERVVECVRM